MRSRADFINKLGVVVEEVDESSLWIEVMEETGVAHTPGTRALRQEADELTRILVRSRETALANRERAPRRP